MEKIVGCWREVTCSLFMTSAPSEIVQTITKLQLHYIIKNV